MAAAVQLYQSNIYDFIEKRLVTGNIDYEPKSTLVARTSMQALSLIPIIGARIAMAMICLHGAGQILGAPVNHPGTLVMGVSNAVGAVVTLGLFSTYNYFTLIDNLTKYQTPEEKEILKKSLPMWQVTAIGASSIAIGVLAQVPMSYAAYSSAFFTPALMYLFQQLDFGRASNSTYLTLVSLLEKPIPVIDELEKSVDASRKTILGKLNLAKRALASKDPTDWSIADEFGKTFGQPEASERSSLMSQPDPSSYKGSDYLDLVFKAKTNAPPPKPLSELENFIVDNITGFSSVAIMAMFYQLGSAGASKILDNQGLRATAGVLVILANTYIWTSLIRRSTQFCAMAVKGGIPSSVEERLMPKLHKILTFSGIALAIPTFVPQMLFAKQYFPADYFYLLGILGSIGVFFAGSAAALLLRNNLIRTITSLQRDPAIKFDTQLQRLSELFTKASCGEIARFLLALPEGMRQSLTSLKDNELALIADPPEYRTMGEIVSLN